MTHLNTQAIVAAQNAASACDPESIEVVAQLSERGESEYFRAMDRCFTALIIASAKGQPLTPVGEVAYAGSNSLQAAVDASAKKWAVGARAASWLGLGWVMADAYKTSAEQRGDTYGDVTVSQSNSINGSGYDTNAATGAPGEDLSGASPNGANAQGFLSNGTRSNTVVVGSGQINKGIQDQSPSAVLQPGNNEKPVAVDNNADFNLEDNDANGDNSLIPGL